MSESIEIQPLHIEIPTKKQETLSTDNRMVVAQYRHMDTGHLLLATGGYMYYNQTQSPRPKYMFLKGDIQTIIFQDGTKVILNADSRLKYTPGFKLFSREVELGREAYFEVTKNKYSSIHSTLTSGSRFRHRSAGNKIQWQHTMTNRISLLL